MSTQSLAPGCSCRNRTAAPAQPPAANPPAPHAPGQPASCSVSSSCHRLHAGGSGARLQMSQRKPEQRLLIRMSPASRRAAAPHYPLCPLDGTDRLGADRSQTFPKFVVDVAAEGQGEVGEGCSGGAGGAALHRMLRVYSRHVYPQTLVLLPQEDRERIGLLNRRAALDRGQSCHAQKRDFCCDRVFFAAAGGEGEAAEAHPIRAGGATLQAHAAGAGHRAGRQRRRAGRQRPARWGLQLRRNCIDGRIGTGPDMVVHDGAQSRGNVWPAEVW